MESCVASLRIHRVGAKLRSIKAVLPSKYYCLWVESPADSFIQFAPLLEKESGRSMRSLLTAQGVLEGYASSDGALVLSITGALDTTSTGQAWRHALHLLNQHQPKRLIVDASQLTYCDGAGAALLLELRRRQESRRQAYEIQSLNPAYQALLDLYDRWAAQPPDPLSPADSPLEQIGRATVAIWDDVVILIAFVGQLCAALAQAARHPRLVRWKDAFLTAELAGVNALPIISLLGFLLGLIMAFQSAIPMRQFGADIYVADLIGLSMLRELGPLLTAIILAGRSGSAFAAELGTGCCQRRRDAAAPKCRTGLGGGMPPLPEDHAGHGGGTPPLQGATRRPRPSLRLRRGRRSI